MKNSNLDIVIKNQEGVSIFEIKEPKLFQRALMNGFKEQFSFVDRASQVIYPEQKIIDSQRVFIEMNSIIIEQ